MSDALSFIEIDGQHVELLPDRTVMSMIIKSGGECQGGNGGTGGTGGEGEGGIGLNVLNIVLPDEQTNNAANGYGGAGGNANGGSCYRH